MKNLCAKTGGCNKITQEFLIVHLIFSKEFYIVDVIKKIQMTMEANTKNQKKVSKAKLRSMSVIDLMNEVVEETNKVKEFVPENAKAYCGELMSRLSLPTTKHASLLSAFINFSYDFTIELPDIAKHYDMRNLKIMAESETIEWFVSNGYIKTKSKSGGKGRNVQYYVPNNVMESLAKGVAPEKEAFKAMDAIDFIDKIDFLCRDLRHNEIDVYDFFTTLHGLIDANGHIEFVKIWKETCKDDETLLVYIVMSLRCIFHNDDHIIEDDLEDYFSETRLRSIVRTLGNGDHTLMKQGLIENCIEEGQADSQAWKLTDKSKYEVYKELKLKAPVACKTNLTPCSDIKEKALYYNENVTKQVGRLTELLDKDRMIRVLKKMEDKGMRKGFTCLFYGGPGTGKTETVMQLARQTGRDIMLVDVPSIRSKWVGETEKNIKNIFDRYKASVRDAEKSGEAAPILVFNEADAILNKRLEGGTKAIDKMENAMQNIILQEMENLEGVMIATTNLTGSLDAAFERRFLYKIEFEKPTPKERQHIWKAMLKDLTNEQAYDLAERFDFSGGQIENIARKRIINDILDENEVLDMQAVIESCKSESLNAKNERKRIGFAI